MNGPLKWHGGKAYLASKIISLMPPRCKNPNKAAADDAGWLHYVEPYFGGGQVLFAMDPEGISEVANDLNRELINFWHVLADAPFFKVFLQRASATPFSEEEYQSARRVVPIEPLPDPFAAWAFFVACRQSLAGRMKGFTGITK